MGAGGDPRLVDLTAVIQLEVALHGPLYGHRVNGAQSAVDGRLTGYEILCKKRGAHGCGQQDERTTTKYVGKTTERNYWLGRPREVKRRAAREDAIHWDIRL